MNMAGLQRWMSMRGIALVMLVAITCAAIMVIIYDATSVPDGGSAPAPAAPVARALPRMGRVIGVMAVPATWTTIRSPRLPFTMGYPPGWRVQRLDGAGAPSVVLVADEQARVLTISGRRLRAGLEAQHALATLAVTPVPHTRDPQLFIRSYPYVPRRSQVTNVVAFAQAGYLWTARLVQPQDVHLPEGLRALQGMLATFTVEH
jgi:hypothetical protein